MPSAVAGSDLLLGPPSQLRGGKGRIVGISSSMFVAPKSARIALELPMTLVARSR